MSMRIDVVRNGVRCRHAHRSIIAAAHCRRLQTRKDRQPADYRLIWVHPNGRPGPRVGTHTYQLP